MKNRYERKFWVQDLSEAEVELGIKLNPQIFREIYYKRQVNSLYFDTENFENYFDNINGATKRAKVRIRWYGTDTDFISGPVLEIKTKQGYTGDKKTLPLKDFRLDELLKDHKSCLENACSDSLMLTKLQLLKPVVLVQYSRKYFESANKLFRLTIDSDIKFTEASRAGISLASTKVEGKIIELKYPTDAENVDKVTCNLPFRLTKFSKYTSAISAVYGFK